MLSFTVVTPSEPNQFGRSFQRHLSECQTSRPLLQALSDSKGIFEARGVRLAVFCFGSDLHWCVVLLGQLSSSIVFTTQGPVLWLYKYLRIKLACKFAFKFMLDIFFCHCFPPIVSIYFHGRLKRCKFLYNKFNIFFFVDFQGNH